MESNIQIWTTKIIDGQKALLLQSSDPHRLRQKAHDLKGAIRTLELACELGAFQALGTEKAEAVSKAIRILASEAKIVLDLYQGA